ncbi:hypothetical protein H3H37_20845 [Duganella sp. LX20W]|uniref:DUF4214 domain-containing protein n=1 Tax=Rugamonas brunnea TaxID=2758569 RepID=A0A7W2EVS0_9BURK|nr:hypothetical protein [Rugamonas brunnea]MBA5639512.1 hypothetical protein [Rugamonas brunnea]
MTIKAAISVLAVVLTACLSACGGGGSSQSPAQASTGGTTTVPVPNTPATPGAPTAGDIAYENLIQQLYLAYFGHPPDPAGLTAQMQAFHAAGAPTTPAELSQAYASNPTVRNLVENSFNTLESNQFYYTGSNAGLGFVSVVYDTLFSHLPNAADAKYWDSLLQDGHTARSAIMLSILAGAQGSNADILARKVRAGTLLTHSLDVTGQSASYAGPIARMIVGAMIHNTASMQDDSALQSSIDATLRRLSLLVTGTVVEAPAGARNVLLLTAADQMAGNGARVRALASALSADLNGLRPGGPTWTVTVKVAADTVAAIRSQLRSYHSAILIGRVPVPTKQEIPELDYYRLPDCPLIQVNDAGEVSTSGDVAADPRCNNGLLISVLRGRSAASDMSDVGRKLDQMIAYHKSSSATNMSWGRRLFYVQAGWFGGPSVHMVDQMNAWAGSTMFPQDAISYPDAGSSVQRRDAFVDCIIHGNEICGANLHGAPLELQFEGPGTPDVFYSSDMVSWHPADLVAGAVQAKYITLDSCGTQNFLVDQSVGTTLLMNGNALLTRGFVEPTWISNTAEADVIRNEYGLLQNGATFAEALSGRLDNSSGSIQGDPYITMRPAPGGPQPKLVIDGTHVNSGVSAYSINLPDSVNGSRLAHIITYSNRGNADLHLRIGVAPTRISVDMGDSRGYQRIGSDGSVFYTDFVQTFSDGSVLAYPSIETETYGGAMHATIKPGQSMAVTYRMKVDGGSAPVKAGQYVWDMVNTSDDPASGRVTISLMARVR